MQPVVFELLSRRMEWLSQRQAVLGQNVANADTPRYRPMDVVEPDFRAMLSAVSGPAPVELARSHPRHAAGIPPADPGLDGTRQRRPWEVAPAGNAVVLDEQMGKLAETNLEHQVTINLRRKYSQMRKIALGVGQGG